MPPPTTHTDMPAPGFLENDPLGELVPEAVPPTNDLAIILWTIMGASMFPDQGLG